MTKKYYTIGELVKMGIKENDLKYRFYRGNHKRYGITMRHKIVSEKVVSEEAFQKYFKKLIK